MRYIIKNCPNFIAEYSYFDACKCKKSNTKNGVHQQYCKDIPDCLLKQIAEKCKIYKDMDANTTNDYARREVALKILEMLDIKECE